MKNNDKINSKYFSKKYDEDIREQGEDYQIKKYYEPQESCDRLRIEFVLDALQPKKNEEILDIG